MNTLKLVLPKGLSEWISGRSSYHWYYSGMVYAAILPISAEKGTVRLKTKNFYTCREDVAHYHARLRSGRLKENSNWFTKTCVLHFIKQNGMTKDYAAGAEAAVKTTNVIEKTYGWPLTRVYKCEVEDISKTNLFFYFEGPGKWIKSPQLLSLYLLILRMGYHLGPPSSKEKRTELHRKRSIKSVLDFWNKQGGTTDISRFKIVSGDIEKLLNNFDKLFRDRSMHALYSPGGYVKNEGIEKFLRGHSSDGTLIKAWKELK